MKPCGFCAQARKVLLPASIVKILEARERARLERYRPAPAPTPHKVPGG